MSVSKKSDLLQFLGSLDTYPKKRLSQNFLIDKNIVDKIISAASIQKGESVLEIGSGPGSLTEGLLSAGASLTAVEKDELFAKQLSRFSGISVFSGDIRDFPLDSLTPPTKVVSNLPYHLTSPILGLLLPRFDLFSDLILMVQKEVAIRMVAKKGRDFSAFTLFVNFYSKPELLFEVSPTSFYPVPKVTSMVVKLSLIKREVEWDQKQFFATVKQAFQHRRKQLRSSLKAHFAEEKITKALETLSLSPQARPEELTIDEWLRFFSLL